ncbi:sensor histidine kinase [Paraburkholderia sp. RL17-381-BIF-C]|jgi:signal transduction histidine kinase|uniref:sensor histidine kinase n=1 Tax=Paraburkholderia sp. RL17-381-BIF-C TaxID=3031635 RepID=UPI0038BD2961
MGREMGINMSAHLASTEFSSVGSALNCLVVTDAMMKPACRASAGGFLTGAYATEQPVEAPPLSNEILAMVAHELRGPLTPLRMASELIRSASAERPEILRLIDMIDRQVNGIARLAQDLMDATRVDRGALRLNKVDLEIATLLADSCEITAAAATAKNQAFSVSIPDRTLRVEGDPVRLTQAVSNLLHNAVKYTQARGNIRMTVLAEGNNVVIKIKDDGTGISPVLLPHIFELFAQSSRTIAFSAGGLGIGLAVVNAIAQAHGGAVSAASAGPGQGSEFTLKLPIVA